MRKEDSTGQTQVVNSEKGRQYRTETQVVNSEKGRQYRTETQVVNSEKGRQYKTGSSRRTERPLEMGGRLSVTQVRKTT